MPLSQASEDRHFRKFEIFLRTTPAEMRSVANEQLRETRLVMITRGRLAVGLNPFWMLRPERIMQFALKLGVTRNFRDED